MKKRWLGKNFKIAAILISFEINKNYSVSIKRVVNNWFKVTKNEMYKLEDIITVK